MGRPESRLRAHVRRALCFASVAVGMLAPSPASAGDGARVENTVRTSRITRLADGAHPVFGAAPQNLARAEATFVYLHGVCGLSTNGCGHFEGAPGWLVCPRADHACPNGGSSWSGSTASRVGLIDAALDVARAAWPESARAPVVLVGFSQGAYVAMDVARAEPGRYAGLLLLGADTSSAIESLRASRVSRIAIACGAFDMMFPKMRATPAALVWPGISARFASLGNVGHTYAAADGTDDTLASLLEWVVAGERKPEVAVRSLD